jgi:hypothetical protein
VAQPPPPPYGSGLKLNEAQSVNTQTIADPNGMFSGWLEIFNTTVNQFALGFMFLSDDPSHLTKHRLVDSPSMLMAGHEHMVLWADGDTSLGPDHLIFTLDPNGGWVYFTSPDGESVIDSVQYPAMGPDESYGRDGDGNSSWIIFPTPTPDAPNVFSSIDRRPVSSPRIPSCLFVSDYLITDREVHDLCDWTGSEMPLMIKYGSYIDFQNFSSGLYILRFQDGSRSLVIKN